MIRRFMRLLGYIKVSKDAVQESQYQENFFRYLALKWDDKEARMIISVHLDKQIGLTQYMLTGKFQSKKEK